MHPSDVRNILDDEEIRKTMFDETPLVFANDKQLTGEIVKPYSCAKCGKKVATVLGLTYHCRAMHRASKS